MRIPAPATQRRPASGRHALTIALAAGLLAASLAAGNVASANALSFSLCPGAQRLQCASLNVPLDRRGVVHGTVSLSLRRLPAGSTPTRDAVVTLAGGPGQAAVPLVGDFAQLLAPALATRDLLVFDQRGTGESGPLHCSALNLSSSASAVARCARQLGPARGDYTTSDSVDDIEAIRAAAGYDKLVLVGVSYGTKVALEYAQRFPQHVERLVIDSVVGPHGPDPLQQSTFAAVGRVLSDLCRGACNGITANPTADIAQLVARMNRSPLSGRVFDGSGARHRLTINAGDLLAILTAGDENPALRALLPGAVRAALRGDAPPLLRLALLTAGVVPDGASPARLDAGAARPQKSSPLLGPPVRALGASRIPHQGGGSAFDDALFVTTTCEETEFPWDRGAGASARLGQASGAAHALPNSAVYPFDQLSALLSGPIPLCLAWPDASPAPSGNSAPLPPVPTLVISGAADLRTPAEDARKIAGEISGAQQIVVPHTGHSVLSTDRTGCSQAALSAFFADSPVAACPPSANQFNPTPVPPTNLSRLPPATGIRGRAGRAVTGVLDTLVDLRRQIIGATLQAASSLSTGSRFGGLRGGRAVLTGFGASSGVRLFSLSYIPGLTVDGSIAASLLTTGSGPTATLRISGSNGIRGTLRLSSGNRVSGTLGGRRFSATVARAASASDGWPAVAPLSSTPGLARIP